MPAKKLRQATLMLTYVRLALLVYAGAVRRYVPGEFLFILSINRLSSNAG